MRKKTDPNARSKVHDTRRCELLPNESRRHASDGTKGSERATQDDHTGFPRAVKVRIGTVEDSITSHFLNNSYAFSSQ